MGGARDERKALSRSVPSILLVLCFALFVSVSLAEAKAEYSGNSPNPGRVRCRTRGMSFFCEKVKEYSNGRIEIKFFPDGLLGTHDESFHAVQMGSEALRLRPLRQSRSGGMLNWMPWTIENWEECKVAFMPPTAFSIKSCRRRGTKWDAQLFVVPRVLWSRQQCRPLRSPMISKNLKMRVFRSLASVKMLGNMGKGTAHEMETIPWAELYNALSRGVVDGCWSMWPSLVEERHYEVLKHYSDVNFLWT
jgi:TRAP-type C4-dicarboxylate transport system substrate-binding protein